MKATIIIEKNVPATMRDGTILYADVYRPAEEGKHPVLLSRIPYGKHDPFYSHRYLDTNRLVENGYVVIIQDVRGRFASEGEFSMFQNEAKDGYDTVEWAAALTYSNGKVGMFGLSYYGYTQLLAATEKPPHLEAIFPAQTLNDSRNGSLYQDGALSLGLFHTLMIESFMPDLMKRTYKDPAKYVEMMQKWAYEVDNIKEWYQQKPINASPYLEKFGIEGDFLEMISHELDDEAYWKLTSILDKYSDIQVPAFHVAGWYDCFLNATTENFMNLQKETNQMQKLMIGPWAHGDFGSVIGDRSFGMAASEHMIDLQEDLTGLHLRWFDYWLKGERTKIMEEAPVKVFVMGINEWREENEWPLARTEYIPFYFHGNGKANTRTGDGSLSCKKPLNEPADQFIYNPENPVPTKGGGVLFDDIAVEGPRDQQAIEDREDVLVYTSETFTEPMEVTGPVSVKLWAKTDAKDTDFTAKLIDVSPDGTAYNLTDGIIRARYRNGYQPAADLNQEIIEYDINLAATSNVFLPGHRIRVEISSSSFPRFDLNPNTGDSLFDTTEMKPAQQTVYHEEDYSSYIVLPVIPKENKK
ncbi:MAG TPA: CocE/NonD family hydrolase [Pseudogracilibacillus sp.]|nr:CocE/NonD family hydrolase [Pseudogracilibacillus sp.]